MDKQRFAQIKQWLSDHKDSVNKMPAPYDMLLDCCNELWHFIQQQEAAERLANPKPEFKDGQRVWYHFYPYRINAVELIQEVENGVIVGHWEYDLIPLRSGNDVQFAINEEDLKPYD